MEISRLVINGHAFRLSPREDPAALQTRIVSLMAAGPAFLTFITDSDVTVQVLLQASTSVLFETHSVFEVSPVPEADFSHLDYDDLAWAV